MDKLGKKNKNHLVVATCYSRELCKGKIELEVFMENRDISVMFVTKTHLKERRTRVGGVAILVRNDLQAR